MQIYDPNQATRLDNDHTIELTFQIWQYRHTATIAVGGNALGFDNIDTALLNYYDDHLPANNRGVPYLELTAPSGEKLITEDTEERGDAWLKDMLVEARITGLQATQRPFFQDEP